MSAQYSLLQVDGYGGPFDLLLDLARERKLDISRISLGRLTDDFLHALNKQPLSAELLGDFLVVAATLLLLKVRRILPQLSEQEETEVDDLTERLKAYQLYRERADWVREQWARQRLFSKASFGPISAHASANTTVIRISVSELQEALGNVLQRLPKPLDVRAHVRPRGRTFQECLDLFWQRLQHAQVLNFREATSDVPRQERAVSFLATLELARQQRVTLSQDTLDSDLLIERL